MPHIWSIRVYQLERACTSQVQSILDHRETCVQARYHQRRTKSTRKRNTPENAGNRLFPESAFSGVLRFRVCFGALLEGNKEHPKTQHTRKRRFWEQSITCVFGCVAFSGALWRLPIPSGRPRFGSVRLRFRDGTVQAVPVFGSGGSSAKVLFCVSV